MNSLTGLRVAVTGGTSGLGLALVRALSARGARVAFVARGRERVQRVAADCPGSHGIIGDVSLQNVLDVDSHLATAGGERFQPEQPDALAMRDEVRQLLERHIDKLPAAFRTVFVLRALEELSVEETATSLGIPEATVRTRFFRARSLLRDALEQQVDLALGDAFSFDGARCDRIVGAVLDRFRAGPAAGPAG